MCFQCSKQDVRIKSSVHVLIQMDISALIFHPHYQYYRFISSKSTLQYCSEQKNEAVAGEISRIIVANGTVVDYSNFANTQQLQVQGSCYDTPDKTKHSNLKTRRPTKTSSMKPSAANITRENGYGSMVQSAGNQVSFLHTKPHQQPYSDNNT